MLASEWRSEPMACAGSGEIPVIDISGVLSGNEDARAACARQLRHAYEDVGFWFLTGHRIPQALIDTMFAEAVRFHALPMEEKLRIRINEHNIGYLAMKAATTRYNSVAAEPNAPNLNEAFFVKRDLPADHPDVVANRRFRGPTCGRRTCRASGKPSSPIAMRWRRWPYRSCPSMRSRSTCRRTISPPLSGSRNIRCE
jgi:hypothetical protein